MVEVEIEGINCRVDRDAQRLLEPYPKSRYAPENDVICPWRFVGLLAELRPLLSLICS